MAYNTRRSNDSLNQVGQRRNPPIGNSFVPGGQLAPNRPQGNQQQMQQQRVQQQGGNQSNGNFRPQQQQGQQRPPQNIPQGVQKPPIQQQQQQPQRPPQQQQPQQQSPAQQQTPQQQSPQKPPAQPQQQQQPQQAKEPVPEKTEMEVDQTVEGEEGGETKKKPFWAKSSVRISRKEKQRRRNLRLSKMLQPKNAVMILNELVKTATYTVSENPEPGTNQYSAAVIVEGITHNGFGRSKMEAKNVAAESAIKYIIKNRQLSAFKVEDPSPETDGDGDQSMEVTDDSTTPLPWQQVASFALFKLLASWGEDPNQSRNILQQEGSGPVAANTPPAPNNPAKKMPDNAGEMNPLMLMNQMLPQAKFEELDRQGTSPNLTFFYKCTVNGEEFSGQGPNKKAAKKIVAYAVCTKILDMKYPPEVYTPVV